MSDPASSGPPRRRQQRPIDIHEASRSLKRLCRSLENKLARFPGGGFAIIVTSHVKEGRPQTVRRKWQVVGDLKDAVEVAIPHIENALILNAPTMPRLAEYVQMPQNSGERARKLRRVLADAWRFHTQNTAFEGKKQMYNIVKDHPEMVFGWWDAIAAVPFTNTAITDPEVSERVFRYLAPRVYDKLKREFTENE